jgi:hypothetical protein
LIKDRTTQYINELDSVDLCDRGISDTDAVHHLLLPSVDEKSHAARATTTSKHGHFAIFFAEREGEEFHGDQMIFDLMGSLLVVIRYMLLINKHTAPSPSFFSIPLSMAETVFGFIG